MKFPLVESVIARLIHLWSADTADANEFTLLLLLLCYFVMSEWKKSSSLRRVCGCCGGNYSCTPEFGACSCSPFFKGCHIIIVAKFIITVLS